MHRLRGGDRSLQDVIRTDLIRLIPFQVQMAIQDTTSETDSQLIAKTLYQGGTLLTDTITDWMIASFVTKTTNEQAEQLMQNNYTTFDSIALELVKNSTSTGMIDGQELSLVEISFEGVTLWERIGTGTPPMEPDIIELIQRATFLEDRSLKADIQTAVNNLLLYLGIDSVDGVQPITIVDVRAYIVPPSSITGDDKDEEQGQGEAPPSGEGGQTSGNANKNLETIIIVAIVVAVLAFGLLVFAVVWAWRSDRKERGSKPSSSSRTKKPKKEKVKEYPVKEKKKEKKKKAGKVNGSAAQKRTSKGAYHQAPAESSVENGSSYDLPHNDTDGSYPKVVGKTGNDYSAYPEDSVISDDVSNSLTAYYKSGMGYSASKASTAGSREPRNFNDNASLSSMDSYGYSLDGYAPSLGAAQPGYPVGPMAAARDAPMPMGDTDISKLQDEESVDDYDK